MVSRLDTKTELGAIKELKEEYLEPFMHLMMQYECAMLEVQTKLEVLNKELALVNSRNPFESIKARLKSPESIYGKMQRKGIPFSIENIEKNLNDIAGIRITCSFFSEIYFVADMIARQDNLEVISIKDYISQPKESGYKSYHMLLSIPVALGDAKVPTKVELQIRTMAMDFWASLEHKIYYKYEGNAPDYFERELQECASIISRLDTKMMSLNEAMKKIDGDGQV